jgi:hypothetical protein
MNQCLTVERIEYAVTYRCNSRCDHCFVDRDTNRSSCAAVDVHLAVDIVQKIVHTHHPSSVMTFGGEPLLYYDTVCAIHQAAKSSSIASRQVITNAAIPQSAGRAREVAFMLAESGVNDVCISVDAFHQQYLSLDIVERNVSYYVDAGIRRLSWNPCWVVSPNSMNPLDRRTVEILKQLAHLPVETGTGNTLQPSSNACKSLGSYLPARTRLPAGSCRDVPYGTRLDSIECITVEPSGDITTCPEWIIGNAVEEDVIRILEGYDPHQFPEGKAILEGGIQRLAELCHEAGVDTDLEGYYSICDMCRSLRRALHVGDPSDR